MRAMELRATGSIDENPQPLHLGVNRDAVADALNTTTRREVSVQSSRVGRR